MFTRASLVLNAIIGGGGDKYRIPIYFSYGSLECFNLVTLASSRLFAKLAFCFYQTQPRLAWEPNSHWLSSCASFL